MIRRSPYDRALADAIVIVGCAIVLIVVLVAAWVR
jgi:hypothetical protein